LLAWGSMEWLVPSAPCARGAPGDGHSRCRFLRSYLIASVVATLLRRRAAVATAGSALLAGTCDPTSNFLRAMFQGTPGMRAARPRLTSALLSQGPCPRCGLRIPGF